MPVSQECLETRTKEFIRLEPTAKGGELWIACDGTGVSTGGRAHSPLFFCTADQRVQHVRKLLCECLDMCTTDNRHDPGSVIPDKTRNSVSTVIFNGPNVLIAELLF